ncbi:uncharacterized protein LOC131731694 [Acipenser ruthenus]|uniref:uncharacterized protein LOC131731694 n=1 Tax=Acipenser ruthenus TaxID=7906 RepID=UPI002740C390|nr:uncharacterized protein LOC131731694 [Acipenser ruthenus]
MEVDKLIRWMQEQEGKREAREVQRQEQLAQFFGTLVTKMMAPGSTEATVARMFAVQPKLLKMTTEDDPEAFLETFERMAEAAAWPKELWALKLAPLLQVIPAGVAAWVRRNQPQSLEEAVCLAEAYQDAEAAAAPSEGSSGKRTNTSPKDIQKKVNPKEGNRKPPLWVPRLAPRWVTEKTSPPEEFWRDKPRTSPGPIICFRCGEPGHIARQCQQEEIERMEVGVARSIAYGHAGPVSADPFVIPVRVEGQETIALIDSGSTETLAVESEDNEDFLNRAIELDRPVFKQAQLEDPNLREVPQASTGFSPFELLFGRQPRGLLDVLREAWEAEPARGDSVAEYVTQLRDRLGKMSQLVQEHLRKEQSQQERQYNQGARAREFKEGDRVLVLVPSDPHKFVAKWQGPVEIVEKVGPVNYKVHQPGKRKTHQIYHVNLLKPWKERECLFFRNAKLEGEDETQGEPKVPQRHSICKGEHLNNQQQKELNKLLSDNSDVFSEEPGITHLGQHQITTEPGVKVCQRHTRVPAAKRVTMKEEVRKMLELGVIRESFSDWCSPVVMVTKPDGSIRFCIDFRKLNAVSKFDAYPMPRVDELLERVGNARYISTLDLTKGYWQVPLSPDSCEKTAFSTPQGLFEFVVLPFGLHGAPATFQRLMDRVLRPHAEYAGAYLDDVVVFSHDWPTHLQRLQAVLNSIRQAGLTANPKKCKLAFSETQYLGYTMGQGLVKPQETKVNALRNYPRPTTQRQVRAFLGLAGYYRRFISHFATRATPLTDLTKGHKNRPIQWSKECEAAFQDLRHALLSRPVLKNPDFRKDFILQTDASGVGLGAVLAQDFDGEEHPIMFLSRKLLPREQRYATIEKECLAIKWAVESLKYYLWGRRFTLYTDHAPLRWMYKEKDSNPRLTRWFLALQPYCFEVKHRAGKDHMNADVLSRIPELTSSSCSRIMPKQRGKVCEPSHRPTRRGCIWWAGERLTGPSKQHRRDHWQLWNQPAMIRRR